MKIGFQGLGKLGLPCALAIESKGHQVKGTDISENVHNILKTRKLPYKEELAQGLLSKSKIKLVPLNELVDFADIIFVAIQTPHDPAYEGITRLPNERKDFDYSYLKNGIEDLSRIAGEKRKSTIIVIISTVLPGTIDNEIKPLTNHYIKICYNPFFIAMGTTIRDFLYPEYVLFGIDDGNAVKVAQRFYRTITKAPFYSCSVKEAECIKVFYNTFISTKIGFGNTVMEICDKIGADCDKVIKGLSLANKRVISSKYLSGGMGDGGSCHPRDNIALSYLARKLDLSYDWFENIMMAREKQTEWLASLIINDNKNYSLPVIILGKSFKSESNLITGSPSFLLKNMLMEHGINAEIYDPYVDGDIVDLDMFMHMHNSPSLFFIGTNHSVFKSIDFPEGSIVIDPWRYIPDKSGVDVRRIGSCPSA